MSDRNLEDTLTPPAVADARLQLAQEAFAPRTSNEREALNLDSAASMIQRFEGFGGASNRERLRSFLSNSVRDSEHSIEETVRAINSRLERAGTDLRISGSYGTETYTATLEDHDVRKTVSNGLFQLVRAGSLEDSMRVDGKLIDREEFPKHSLRPEPLPPIKKHWRVN